MERIESFDKYISGEMSETEVAEFKRKLSEDKEFSSDFQIYKMVVKGIVMEENDKEAELDNAFKNLSKDDLRKIVGPKKTIAKTSKSKAKIVYVASWITSVAAVAIIAFSLTFNIQRSARNNVDDIMFDCYYSPVSRGGEDIVDLSKASEAEIKKQLPKMEKVYNNATDEQDISSYGINLAMVYLKIHDRDKARKVLLDVKKKCTDNDVKNICDKLLKQIE
jgi:transcription termination factor NusB